MNEVGSGVGKRGLYGVRGHRKIRRVGKAGNDHAAIGGQGERSRLVISSSANQRGIDERRALRIQLEDEHIGLTDGGSVLIIRRRRDWKVSGIGITADKHISLAIDCNPGAGLVVGSPDEHRPYDGVVFRVQFLHKDVAG